MANPIFPRLADDAVAQAVQAGMRIRRGQDTLLASAHHISNKKIERRKDDSGVAEAWQMRELVGEVRFVTNTVAVKGSKAKLYVGRLPTSQEDSPEPVKGGVALTAWQEFTRDTDMPELIKRALANLQIAGIGYLCGIPGNLLGRDYEDMEWYFLSQQEVKDNDESTVTLKVLGAKIETTKQQVKLIEVWNPHPLDSSRPDSPIISALPILREIVGLTMHVAAQIDSRLAGAGLLAIPQSATLAVETADETESDIDPFTAALLEAMETAIVDRSAASALVPVTITIPDEAVDKIKHIKFWTELDAEARGLREEGIRRFALAMDCPPELLLGESDMNHWGAWVSREETVQNNVEPLLDILVRAITQEYLWPALIEAFDQTEEQARRFCIHFDTKHLISRSNRTQDALNLHARGVISDEALRNTADFDEKDAPQVLIKDPAMKVVMDLVKASPSLAESPGIPVLVEQIRAMMDASGDGEDTGRALTPPEENANPTGPSETPAQGLPPGEGGTRESETK